MWYVYVAQESINKKKLLGLHCTTKLFMLYTAYSIPKRLQFIKEPYLYDQSDVPFSMMICVGPHISIKKIVVKEFSKNYILITLKTE